MHRHIKRRWRCLLRKKYPMRNVKTVTALLIRKQKRNVIAEKSSWRKKYKNMTTGYECLMFLLVWYSTATTLFAAILSTVFLNDCITFFSTIGKGIVSLFQEFVTGADSFGQLSNEISNSIISGIVYWLIAAIVIYFGEWIKSILPINLIALLLLVHVVYIGIICYVKDWLEKRGHY